MKNKKYLLVISNHNPEKWDMAQRENWDKIFFYPFPNVDPKANKVDNEVKTLKCQIEKFYEMCDNENMADGYVNLQGEFTVCYHTYKEFNNNPKVKFVFPTTERVVEEIKNNGIIEKKSLFRFVQWR